MDQIRFAPPTPFLVCSQARGQGYADGTRMGDMAWEFVSPRILIRLFNLIWSFNHLATLRSRWHWLVWGLDVAWEASFLRQTGFARSWIWTSYKCPRRIILTSGGNYRSLRASGSRRALWHIFVVIVVSECRRDSKRLERPCIVTRSQWRLHFLSSMFFPAAIARSLESVSVVFEIYFYSTEISDTTESIFSSWTRILLLDEDTAEKERLSAGRQFSKNNSCFARKYRTRLKRHARFLLFFPVTGRLLYKRPCWRWVQAARLAFGR